MVTLDAKFICSRPHYTGWAIKVSYCTFSISSLNIDQFSHFLHQ